MVVVVAAETYVAEVYEQKEQWRFHRLKRFNKEQNSYSVLYLLQLMTLARRLCYTGQRYCTMNAAFFSQRW